MKRLRRRHRQDPRGASGGRRASLVWVVLGLLGVGVIAATPWLVRARTADKGTPAGEDLRARTVELMAYASSIHLTPEQQTIKTEALSAISTPCGNRSTLAVGCCRCNLGRTIGGLANHLIAREGADAARVRQAVLDWIDRTNPAGYSGAACDRKRCERPFGEDGCGGMNEARAVF